MRYLADQSIFWTSLCLICGWIKATQQTGNLRKIPGSRVTSRMYQAVAKEGRHPLLEKENAGKIQTEYIGEKDKINCSREHLNSFKCNTSISGSHGHIASPNYPQVYPANQHCLYHISLPHKQSRIQFRFLHLGLERGHDWLRITWPNYEEMLTGSDVPSFPIVTSQNTATITFHSDEDIEETGFLIQFDALDIASKEDQAISVSDKSGNWQEAEATVCGGVFVAESGFISTPNFPENYTNHLKCRWTIKGPAHSMINLTAYNGTFGTEAQHDQLLIYSADDTSSSPLERLKNITLLASLSGHLSSPTVNIVGQASSMLLEFSTDKSDTEMGFQLHYSIIHQNVSTTDVWAPSGVLQSAHYPEDYAINQRVTWIVHGSPRGSIIRIMDLELDKDAQDHLMIARGDNLQEGIISTLFGSLNDLNSALVTIANSSTFVVHFASHYHKKSRRGWIISYEPCRDFTIPPNDHDARPPELDAFASIAQRKNVRRLPDFHQLTGPIDDMTNLAYSASSYAVRGAGTFSTVPIMEIEVEPFHPQQDWQGDLKECLCSMLPRSILRHQRRPAIKTTVLHWGEGDIVRVMITTAEGTDDFVQQLRSALSTGKVRCNDTLEMYLPDLIRDVQSNISGQNWLLASICIIAFFVITFSALLFIHCKQRRVIVRKKKPTSAETSTMPSIKGPMINVVMEPSIQRNPLYEIKKPASKSNTLTDTTAPTPKNSLKKCRPASCVSVPAEDQYNETVPDDGFDYPAPADNIRMYPQVCRGKSMGGTVISQNIPSLTQGYNRKLDIILEPNDEETVSVKSVSATSDRSDDCCQLDADMGEILEVSCEALAPESYASLMDEWRNGRPMTVRAVKQKSHFKKQMKKDIFDGPVQQVASSLNDPSPV